MPHYTTCKSDKLKVSSGHCPAGNGFVISGREKGKEEKKIPFCGKWEKKNCIPWFGKFKEKNILPIFWKVNREKWTVSCCSGNKKRKYAIYQSFLSKGSLQIRIDGNIPSRAYFWSSGKKEVIRV